MADDAGSAASAVHEFQRARRRADLSRLVNQMGGGRTRLLPYDEVRRRLRAVESAGKRLEDVPVDAIVGSVGRYNDFTREFLPRNDSDQGRWVGVQMAMTGLQGVPPVELYRLGDAYFVRDGNHRVSVARQLGVRTIQAYVTPVRTRVPYSASDDLEELILKGEYADFLEATRLDELRPGADLEVTEPGAFESLLEHISVHRYYMGIDQDREVGYEEAVAHWYDRVYLPLVESIRTSGILRGFPGRTEADLYLWLADHRARIEDELGWKIPGQQVVQGVAGGHLAGPEERGALLRHLAEDEAARSRGYLADDLLVAFDLGEAGRQALDQALVLARREGARIYGLRVLPDDAPEEERQRTREAFQARCREAGITGQLAFRDGDPLARILERATWVDVVIANLAYGGGGGREATLAGAIRPLLRRSPRPLLALSGTVTALERPLVAYDGGPRSETALFAAVYAAVKWSQQPVVLSVHEGAGRAEEALARARAMFERYGARADYVAAHRPVADAIVRVAHERDCDVIMMGSYRYSLWFEEVFGGVLEAVIRRVGIPVLIA